MHSMLLNEVEKHWGIIAPRILSACEGYSLSHYILHAGPVDPVAQQFF